MQRLKYKNILYFIISVIVCVYILRNLLSEISIGQVKQMIFAADITGLLIFLLCSFTMSLFRTLRYRLLLNFSGIKPGIIPLYLIVIVRNFCSDLLPARVGSLIYVFLLNKRLGISLDQATSSFSLALVFDLCSVAPLVLIATIFLGEGTGVSEWVIISAAVSFMMVSIFLIYITPFMFRKAGELFEKFSFIPDKYRHLISGFFIQVNSDISQIKEAGLYTKVFVYSILIRVFKYAGLYFILYALLKPSGYGFAELPWAKVFFGLIVPEFVVSLPISGIAGFGVYQSAWIYMFELLKFPTEIAQLTSLAHHIVSQAYGFGIALLSLVILLLITKKPSTSS